jgi:hypothetical protein
MTRNSTTSVSKLALTILAALLILALVATVGAISTGATGAILAAALYIIGFISVGTAQAITIWFAIIGALLGLLNFGLAGGG